jgi:hypothetical protein
MIKGVAYVVFFVINDFFIPQTGGIMFMSSEPVTLGICVINGGVNVPIQKKP